MKDPKIAVVKATFKADWIQDFTKLVVKAGLLMTNNRLLMQ